MDIYHKQEIFNGQEQLVLYVNYPDEYEFALDFDSIKKNVASVADKIREYAFKNIGNITDSTVLLILNGVVIGTLLVSQLTVPKDNLNTKTEIVATVDQSEIAKQISTVPNFISQPIEVEKLADENLVVATNQDSPINLKSNATKTNTNTNANTNINKGQIVNLRLNNGKVIQIGLEDYVVGVVSAEMPAEFTKEALKAQAVVSRTFALKRISEGKTLSATTADQVYKNENELKQMWGSGFNAYYSKVKQAVSETTGECITYNGAYIDALFFSTSNGTTENPVNVWGGSFPYLKSVKSPWDVGVRSYYGSKSIPMSTISSKLGVNLYSISQISINSKTGGNMVNSITIAGKNFTGSQVRLALGLKSADFDVSVNGNNIVFTTRGWGHGVGMSQYGANGMAKAGKSYKEIIKHYYTGVNIIKK